MENGAEEKQAPVVKKVRFSPLEPVNVPLPASLDFSFLKEVPVTITVELGECSLTVKEVLALEPGKVVRLEKLAGEPVEVKVNGQPFAKGEVIIINEVVAVRITSLKGEEE